MFLLLKVVFYHRAILLGFPFWKVLEWAILYRVALFMMTFELGYISFYCQWCLMISRSESWVQWIRKNLIWNGAGICRRVLVDVWIRPFIPLSRQDCAVCQQVHCCLVASLSGDKRVGFPWLLAGNGIVDSHYVLLGQVAWNNYYMYLCSN